MDALLGGVLALGLVALAAWVIDRLFVVASED